MKDCCCCCHLEIASPIGCKSQDISKEYSTLLLSFFLDFFLHHSVYITEQKVQFSASMNIRKEAVELLAINSRNHSRFPQPRCKIWWKTLGIQEFTNGSSVFSQNNLRKMPPSLPPPLTPHEKEGVLIETETLFKFSDFCHANQIQELWQDIFPFKIYSQDVRLRTYSKVKSVISLLFLNKFETYCPVASLLFICS